MDVGEWIAEQEQDLLCHIEDEFLSKTGVFEMISNYNFTFRMSGKDLRGKDIKDTASYRQTVRASTQAIAEKKLRSNYYKSVKIEITAMTVTQ